MDERERAYVRNGNDTQVSRDHAYDTNTRVQYNNDQFNAELERQRHETYRNLMEQLTRGDEEEQAESLIPEIVETCSHDWHIRVTGDYSFDYQCRECGEVSHTNPADSL